MKKGTICVIQHSPCETLGRMAEAVQTEHLGVETVQAFHVQQVPKTMDAYDGLVVLGGPMGVYEQEKYGYLRDELRLIEQGLKQKKPILGVCLGSQLLAAALGAKVTPGKQKEIGWYSVRLNDFATTDALWQGVPRSFVAFHWHGDVFELPAGAVPLAGSDLTACQAFRYGANAYGLLFHAEVTKEIIEGMVKAFAGELQEAGIRRESILEPMQTCLPNLHHVGATVFGRWVGMVKTG